MVDIQNAWLQNKDLKASVEKHIKTINEAIGWFRRKGLPIVVVSHESKKERVTAGSEVFKTAKSVEVTEDDIAVTKHYPNSFCKTGLDSLLRKRECDTVVLVGLSASWCVLATYFGAIDCDFTAYLVKGGSAAHNEEHVRFAEEVCDTLNIESFDETLRKS